MKRKTLATAVAITSLAFAGAASAAPGEPSSTEQTRGAASGLVIGAVAGGPAGAFIGAVLGGEVFGKLFEQRRVNRHLVAQVASLEESLEQEKQRYIAATDALNGDLDKLLAIQASQVQSRELPVQFRTGSSDIEPQYEHELARIGRVLARNKDASVVLAGFSDRRGDDAANLKLSEQRVAAVKHFLMSQGAGKSQLLTTAYGESRPLESKETLESNFFDRRVVVELKLDVDSQLATR